MRARIGALGALLALAPAAPAVAAPPTFSGPTPFPAGDFPLSVAVADVTGDGRPDLVTSSSNSNLTQSLAVLRNMTAAGAATPSFAAPTQLGATSGAFSLAAVDVDGDGKLDLITANASPPDAPDGNAVSVRINTTPAGGETPTFAAPLPFDAGEVPRSVVATDVNSDGKPDLVTANEEGSDGNSVLLNTTTAPGTPSFSEPTGFEAGDTPRSLVAADLDRDARPDLVTANSQSSGTASLTVLRNTTEAGASTPSFAGPTPFDAGAVPRWVAASDLNGDGRPDLVTPDFDNAVSVLVNGTARGGALSFSDAETHPAGESPQSVAAADVNRDGKPDLVTANTFGAGNTVLVNATEPGAESPSFAAPAPFGAGTNPFAVIAADLNGDARPDLVTGNQSTAEGLPGGSILLNTTPLPLTAGPSKLGFGSQVLGTIGAPKTITLENSTSATLPVAVDLSGHTDDMLISRNTCGGGVPADGTCAIAIRFAPGATGPRAATLSLDPAGPQRVDVPLTGTGAASPPAPAGQPGSPATPAPTPPTTKPSAQPRATCKAAKPKRGARRTARKRVTCRVRRARAGAAWRVTRAGRTRAKGTLRRGTATLRLRLAPGRYTLSIAGRRAASFRVPRIPLR